MLQRLKASPPAWTVAIAGTIAWAIVLAASAATWLVLNDRIETSQWQAILMIFGLGGALSFVPGIVAARMVAPRGNERQRFAAALLCLGISSVLGVAFVFSMQYRLYYAQWHEPFPTVPWFFQLAFTGANAVYQFAVLGTRMFFPLALVALFAVSLRHARQPR